MAYTPINWVNGVTPLNDSNLNKMDAEIAKSSDKLAVGGTEFYFDVKDGVFGWNENAERGADSFHPFKSGGGGLVLQGTAFASNNSAGGNIYATGHVEFALPKGTKVEFTAWNWYANGTKITTGFVTTEEETTVYGEANSATGVRPKTKTNYTITFP